MEPWVRDRVRGCAVGAAVGDALGMPLEFGPPQPVDRLVREMRAARLPAGTFTDDTEMALSVADSLLAHCQMDGADLARRFVAWFRAGPADVGNHTSAVLRRIASGEGWAQAAEAVQQSHPDSAGNGSVMRCWPVALAHWLDLEGLLAASRLQSRITHPHPDCVAGSAFVNAVIYHLLHGASSHQAVARATEAARMPEALQEVVQGAPGKGREELLNRGWVRHTLESAVWSLLTTGSFEDAVIEVVNLGSDADTAGAVVGALAGAAYGVRAIPIRWRQALRGEWPIRSGSTWCVDEIVALADRLAELGETCSV